MPANHKAATIEQLHEALNLRLAGLSYYQIAKQQSTSTTTAFARVDRALRRTTLVEEIGKVRILETARLDDMLKDLKRRAIEAGGWTERLVEVALKVMARRAAIHGLDAPQRHHVTGEISLLEAVRDETFQSSLDEITTADNGRLITITAGNGATGPSSS